mmetsp:Transcript_749/g.995  ORF Transcript_749/g.995 Transcript_749/m.995 type:complete len:117 (+) Transcript_749:859-1209(+)
MLQIDRSITNTQNKLQKKRFEFNKLAQDVPIIQNELAAMMKLKKQRQRKDRKNANNEDERHEIKQAEQDLAQQKARLQARKAQDTLGLGFEDDDDEGDSTNMDGDDRSGDDSEYKR